MGFLNSQGYGMLFPSVGAETKLERCLGIQMFAAFESFFGNLYASFAGAIIFGKVARIQSIAKIIWSDLIVVRHGSGVLVRSVEEEPSCHLTTTSWDDQDAASCPAETTSPCPISEFRIVNQLYNQRGGEIVDGNVSLAATFIAESKADRRSSSQNDNAAAAARRKYLESAERVEEKTLSARQETSAVLSSVQAIQKLNARLRTKRSSESDDDEGSGRQSSNHSNSLRSDDTSSSEEPPCRMPIAADDDLSVPRFVFAKLHSETDSNPFLQTRLDRSPLSR
jgi:hypothetical protein